jgi:hypothetical protein
MQVAFTNHSYLNTVTTYLDRGLPGCSAVHLSTGCTNVSVGQASSIFRTEMVDGGSIILVRPHNPEDRNLNPYIHKYLRY